MWTNPYAIWARGLFPLLLSLGGVKRTAARESFFWRFAPLEKDEIRPLGASSDFVFRRKEGGVRTPPVTPWRPTPLRGLWEGSASGLSAVLGSAGEAVRWCRQGFPCHAPSRATASLQEARRRFQGAGGASPSPQPPRGRPRVQSVSAWPPEALAAGRTSIAEQLCSEYTSLLCT